LAFSENLGPVSDAKRPDGSYFNAAGLRWVTSVGRSVFLQWGGEAGAASSLNIGMCRPLKRNDGTKLASKYPGKIEITKKEKRALCAKVHYTSQHACKN
jgi:hypothetical protein